MKKLFSRMILLVMIFACSIVTTGCVDFGANYTTIVQQNVDVEELFDLFKSEHPDAGLDEFLAALGAGNFSTEHATRQGLPSTVIVRSTFNIKKSKQSFVGAGVVYKIDGNDVYIVTNYHIIFEKTASPKISDTLKVGTYGHENQSELVPCDFVGGNIDKDIAVLRADKRKFKSAIVEVTLANRADIKLGQSVIAIGNPIAGGIAVTAGVVSVLSEVITMDPLDLARPSVKVEVIRTDTPVNSGNSGGGLFNLRGEYVGMVTAKSSDDDVENIGYAIPVDEIVAEVGLIFARQG